MAGSMTVALLLTRRRSSVGIHTIHDPQLFGASQRLRVETPVRFEREALAFMAPQTPRCLSGMVGDPLQTVFPVSRSTPKR
jgi:hypothetical protein